ncbi:cysteine-rich receptor-like protein kinase 10 isoform X2 [Ipomoea triloba]|uniref:cysteine-rich receptor-like protein kinase 10 isoform X2 n=1 Tax=Ipomoea triloba TaxID=35885 RepID=UPI00125E5A87|nr:cysteine-rich receptor-like protein kinase 10 isoform X2 [Ipomoea triloba]
MLNDLSISLPEPLAPGLFIHGSISSEASSQFTKNAKSISDQYHRKMQKQKARSYAKTVEESSSSVEISQYELITIQNGTNNFSEANKLGIGRFGPVYKGKLENGLEFVVTWLSKNTVKGGLEFKNEVKLIGRLQHKNLVRLLGYCQEGGEMILVYEFFSNGNLYGFLFDPVKCGYLNWGRRYKIIEGIAKGLVYLHEDSRLRIVHCDVKASNILLDADLNPKIADFGIALLFTLDKPHCGDHVSRYVAPEYISTSELSVKCDVYSFGVLVLEIISGQKWFNLRNEESTEHFSSYCCYRLGNNGQRGLLQM